MLSKYKTFNIELQRMWNMKAIFMSVVAFDLINTWKDILEYNENLQINTQYYLVKS